MARPSRVTVLADTGALYALVDASDAWHERVLRWWKNGSRRVVVPVTVLPEVCYLLLTRIGPAAESAFLRSLVDGELETESLEPEDVARAADIVEAYADMPIGFVDASLVAIAERLELRELLTSDRKHFGVVRPAHVPKLTLLP